MTDKKQANSVKFTKNNNEKLKNSCYATIKNKRGLHARAAAKFTKLCQEFTADIHVSKDDNCVSGQSIMGLMTLSASIGTQIEISAEGQEAEQALKALKQLVDEKFHEE